jgi:hypothetical protein
MMLTASHIIDWPFLSLAKKRQHNRILEHSSASFAVCWFAFLIFVGEVLLQILTEN